MKNLDPATVQGFGHEWTTFDQSALDSDEAGRIFSQYFSLFPWDRLPPASVGFDLGCGSGRWAKLVAARVGHLHCIDASPAALAVAQRALATKNNCTFHCASVGDMPLKSASMDFGYSLGVLHHVPDPRSAIAACVSALKSGAPLLIYLYYALDNRGPLFRATWRASNRVRRVVSLLPHRGKLAVTTALAIVVYLPLATAARVVEKMGLSAERLPLAAYAKLSFYTMRTDAYDRFATRIEHRFSKDEVEAMMRSAGLERIQFREASPYWCAIGYRAQ